MVRVIKTSSDAVPRHCSVAVPLGSPLLEEMIIEKIYRHQLTVRRHNLNAVRMFTSVHKNL